MKNYKIFTLGDNALTVEFGNEISAEMNNLVVRLADFFEKNSFPGFIEIVPAYASLACFYDVSMVRRTFPDFLTAFAAVKNFIENALQNLDDSETINARLIEIPVCFDAEFALDLEFVARTNNLTTREIIEIFLARTYRVFMLGFLPGFAYMGEVNERIAAPRKDSPRLKVPKGSVGIAGRQTGIYSLESPGGWQIIGRTNVEMFTPNEKSPTFLQTGDSVKFYEADF
ncbi:MAG: 5-oxoprolinase subunit PxpB [Pyrinomonadaceae bacterium]|nr:5-oxoprolinase subunit PxpB [Pyrinomonadaceae bacterium]